LLHLFTQGADPASLAFLNDLGLDYVSCGPFRVPIARLAAAQAAVKANRRTKNNQ
jgi:pyruvate,orthophosphate dikinase